MTKLLYRVAEAADVLSLSERKVYELASKGVLEKRFVGKGTRNYRIPHESLAAYVAGLSTEPVKEAS